MTDDGEGGRREVPHIQTEQELRRMNEAWVTALVGRDGETLRRIMAEDCIFIYPLEGDDREQFVTDVEAGTVVVEYLHRENVTVRVYGSAAVLTGRDSAKWIYEGMTLTGQYKTIHVYAERDGRWQLVAVQACPITR
jgi:ketosteroid isomerase-like protein